MRIIWIVIDSVGIGELPDANLYGDEGSNTLGNLYKAMPKLKLPNMEKLGLGNIQGVSNIPRTKIPAGAFGKAGQKSPGKDTTTGHWEMAGIILEKPFPLFPNGFPDSFIQEFQDAIGRKVLGNYAASGTEIINILGEKHMETGSPIVYTSGDSVFQIAAHEDVIPLKELYSICEKARELLKEDLAVGRVIARPFTGSKNGDFVRTANRHDYALDPFHDTVLNRIEDKGLKVYGIGKIHDIFNGYGVSESSKMNDNRHGMLKVMEHMKIVKEGLIFINLVDFDMKFGHRNDVEGYAQALMVFDEQLGELMEQIKEDDILIINADHGCDPTTASTDHSREYVPILVYGTKIKNVDLGIRESFSDIGQTVAELLETKPIRNGKSFADKILDH
ncbi:phosphopentomutase [Alkalibacter mobilis]|uniref:phosphopentomutase n=1 Tax=Alkalibacter mobilis TaxID=2787712 RepID=UPI0018A00B60|nr:phosphopentomutase [Alkalibacter mobilis]MBF7097138.1 phosphopentomutase [Alkalibacter mobilis]